MTQQELANHFHVTPQTVLMLEQGLFNTVPDQIRRTLGVTDREYRQWIKHARNLNSPFFDQATTVDGWVPFRNSVHKTFRGFCRKLVFQPSILREYEMSRQRNRQLLSEALIEVGLSDTSLTQLRLITREDIANAS